MFSSRSLSLLGCMSLVLTGYILFPTSSVQAASKASGVCLSSSVTRLPSTGKPFTRLFVGTIGTSRVTLNLAEGKDGGYVGKYFYGKKSHCLYLGSTFHTASGMWRFEEMDEKGKVTGHFVLQSHPGQWTGTWQKAGVSEQGPSLPVQLHEVSNTLAEGKSITGHYKRIGTEDEAEIDLVVLSKTQVSYRGSAVWVDPSGVEGAVNEGQIEGIQSLSQIIGSLQTTFDPEASECEVSFSKRGNNKLEVRDNGMCGGLNVTFNGTYERVRSVAS